MRKFNLLLVAALALFLSSGRAFAGGGVDRSLWFAQGFCDDPKDCGQREWDTYQFHTDVWPGWKPDGEGPPSSFWKLVRAAPERFRGLDILPEGTRCESYLTFPKNRLGSVGELWCVNGSEVRLLLEKTGKTTGRFWERFEKGNLVPGLLMVPKGGPKVFLNDVLEQYFHCSKDSSEPVRDQEVRVTDFNTLIGPLNVSGTKNVKKTIASFRALGIVPSYVPDEVAVPAVWERSLREVGRLRGNQPASLVIMEGHWGEVTCTDPARAETCRSRGRELFWFLRVGNLNAGLVRWLYQEWDGSAWVTQDVPGQGGIGTAAGFVLEEEPVTFQVPCQQ